MRLGQWISLLALGISVYILWRIRQVLLLVFLAVVLATVLNQVVRFLQRNHVKRGAAVALTSVFSILVISGFFAIIMPRLVEQFQQLSNVIPQAIEQIQIGYIWLQSKVPGAVLEDNRSLGAVIDNIQAWVNQAVGNIFMLVSSSVNIVLSFLLLTTLTIMLLLNPLQYRRIFVLIFPAFYRPRINETLDECEAALVGWIRGTLIAMVVIGLSSYIGLLILGVPLPMVNAMIAGLLEFIPNVGPTLSVVPPALLAVLDAPWKALGVIGLYILIQQFESLVLVPYVMKHEVSILPVFTVLSVVVFSIFFGFLGLFLAIPLLIVSQIWIKNILIEDVMNQWHDPESPFQKKLIVKEP